MAELIGGFFPLHSPLEEGQKNILQLWNITDTNAVFFHNARSALRSLLQHRRPKTLWLPAYICGSMASVVQETHTQLAFYPITQHFSPDTDFLKRHMQAGDSVLAVDYFGMPANDFFIHFTQQNPQVIWIEDRAQAFLPAAAPWGEYVLYSPRKLLGVADGGILTGKNLPVDHSPFHALPLEFAQAALLRYKDREERHNDIWYPIYKRYEQNMPVGRYPMSDLSHTILAGVDPWPLMEKRKRNYKILWEYLFDIALMPPSDAVPMGFPVRTADRDRIAGLLHENNIFAQIHWMDLPSDSSDFSFEHALSSEILTLPCDHRYEKAHMERIAKLIRNTL